MDKLLALFEEFILKAVVMTEAILAADVDDSKLEAFTANRERLFQIIEKISQQVEWETIQEEKRLFLSAQFDYIKKLDEKLVVKLQEHQEEVKKEIEKTCTQKNNIKGYNLTDVR